MGYIGELGGNDLFNQNKVITSNMVGEIEINYKSKVEITDRVKISKSDDSVIALRAIWSDRVEYCEEFYIIPLSRSNHVLGFVKISQGGIASTVVDNKLIAQVCLLAHAAAVIIAHNHPSGNIDPSPDDIHQTAKVKDGLKFLDIKLLDHIILTSDKHYSFADNGML